MGQKRLEGDVGRLLMQRETATLAIQSTNFACPETIMNRSKVMGLWADFSKCWAGPLINFIRLDLMKGSDVHSSCRISILIDTNYRGLPSKTFRL